jgi:hypothetical protein
LRALTSGSSAFFVHIDRKSDLAPFTCQALDNVTFSKRRVTIQWGDFSMVEATLALIRQALDDPRRFDRLVLLSGNDYPLRSQAVIEQFFDRNQGTEFMNVLAMPSEGSGEAGKPIKRLASYKPSPTDPLSARVTRALLSRVGAFPQMRDYKRALGGRTPYAGSQWWALTRQAAQFVTSLVKTEGALSEYYRNTHCPDEMFFQTILANSSFGPGIRRNLTYTDWSENDTGPAGITEKHLDLFSSTTLFEPDDLFGGGEMLFARKFSDDRPDIVSAVDRLIVQRDG